jgi:hypothetical protein
VKRIVAFRTAPLGCAFVIVFGALLADTTAQPAAPQRPLPEPSHFSHQDHLQWGIDEAAMKQCKTCHSIDAKGMVLAPAAQGHAPCLKSGCHGDDPLKAEAPSFFAISEKNAKSTDPAVQKAFDRAAAFCLGCHEQVPWAWKKPTTRVLQGWVSQREHHIEMAKTATSRMDHWAHTQAKMKNGEQVGCRHCHQVDKDHKLMVGAPGHPQCMQCHNADDKITFAMTECGKCHKSGSQKEWLEEEVRARKRDGKAKDFLSRPKSDVRACDSRGADETKKRPTPKNFKCFKHETKEHRTDTAGEDVQCKKCHWIVTSDPKLWRPDKGLAWSSLADLHLNKVIGDPFTKDRDQQHKACGGSGCHGKIETGGKTPCQLCHAERTQQEPYW